MAEKTLNTRIQQKHDIEANWLKATNFKPKAGEVIVYDADENNHIPRIKIGDGNTLINELPFAVTRPDWNAAEGEEGYIENKPNMVKSFNGVLPNAEGAIICHHSKVVSITDGTAISPDILQYVGINSMSEIVGWLKNPGTYDVVFLRDVRDTAGKSTGQVRSTGFNTYKTAEGNWNAIVYFGDNLCPLILDSAANTLALDPDWIAPAACVKSVNGVLPDDEGNVTSHHTLNIVMYDNTCYPGGQVLCYTHTAKDIVSIFRNTTIRMPLLLRYVANRTTGAIVPMVHLRWYHVGRIDGGFTVRLHFGNEYADIIANNVDDTLTLDPNWVAPACVKSVNDITPDENGNVELPVATDEELIDMMLEIDMLPVIQDTDGSVLVDSDNSILMI